MNVSSQHYWRSSAVPFVELRSTRDSVQSYKPHFHTQLSLGAVIAGQTRAHCKGHEHVLTEGDLVLIAPRAVHSCNPIAQRPRSYHMLYIDEAWCQQKVRALQVLWLGTGCSVIRNAEMFADYLEFVASLPNAPASDVAARLQRLLSAVEKEAESPSLADQQNPLAESIKQALVDNILNPVSLDDLATRFSCRKETLIRVFRRAFHITPHAFLNNLRVEHAKQRLMAGEKIVDVALDLGFSDQAQLHRTFVNYTASTPGQYRRSALINIRQESPSEAE
jgi:AraC-like DNA-binding protein